jgi:hypothetical protein
MKIDWKFLFLLAIEMFSIITFSICVGSLLMNAFPDINIILAVGLSLVGGYLLTYATFFVLGIILGIVAYSMLDEERREKFYDKYLREQPEDDEYDDEYYDEDEAGASDKQLTVATAKPEEISENKVGTYLERQIPEWIKLNGEKYFFSHVLSTNSAGEILIAHGDLEADDLIYPPGMVFKKQQST